MRMCYLLGTLSLNSADTVLVIDLFWNQKQNCGDRFTTREGGKTTPKISCEGRLEAVYTATLCPGFSRKFGKTTIFCHSNLSISSIPFIVAAKIFRAALEFRLSR